MNRGKHPEEPLPAGALFPFSAVVGQTELQLALLLNALDPAIGGVLLRGQKGSGKTTLARGLAHLLGDSAPFVELPVGASEDRLVGTVDLRAVLSDGVRRFVPGLLAAADGGVLYVDEVNLLPDHLVDVLLDVAVSGVNRIEREGISHTHPSRFVLLGSMNPEEGDLRPQLLDRFGLSVDVVSPDDPALRAEAVRRRLEFDANPEVFTARWHDAEQELRHRLESSSPAHLESGIVEAVSELCSRMGAEGLRADLVCCRAAAALAGWEGREVVDPEDVRRVAPMALAHRARRSPFENHGVDREALIEAMDQALGRPREDETRSHGYDGASNRDALDVDTIRGDEAPECSSHRSRSEAGRPGSGAGQPGSGAGQSDLPRGTREPGGGQSVPPAPVGRAGPPPMIGYSVRNPSDATSAPGRRSTSIGTRGRLIGSRVPEGNPGSIALSATFEAAAARGRRIGAPVIEEDLREAVHEEKVANLVVLALDASGSMGVERRMSTAKGVILSLLLDAYQRRDRVALVAFKGDGAEVVLRPTGSIEVARERLAALASGGRTPLADGLRTALDVARSTKEGAYRPLLVVVSDGRATFAPPGTDPVQASLDVAAAVKRAGVASLVVDAEDGPVTLGLAASLAQVMGARYVPVGYMRPDRLAEVVRSALVSQA
jgi:magnesium chelatase subunit D